MSGALIMVFMLVVGLPVVFTVSGAVLAIVLGQSLWHDGEDRSRQQRAGAAQCVEAD